MKLFKGTDGWKIGDWSFDSSGFVDYRGSEKMRKVSFYFIDSVNLLEFCYLLTCLLVDIIKSLGRKISYGFNFGGDFSLVLACREGRCRY